MRVFRHILTFTLLLLPLLAFAEEYAGRVIVRTTQLSEEAEMVTLQLEIWIEGRCVENHAAMRLRPKLIAKENSLRLDDLLIVGKNKRKTYRRWLKHQTKSEKSDFVPPTQIIELPINDTLFHYNASIPYESWMDGALLAVEQEWIGYNDRRSLNIFALQSKIERHKEAPIIEPKVELFTPQPQPQLKSHRGSAYLDFKVGSAQLLPSYRENPMELDKINSVFDKILKTPNVEVEEIEIVGYASPEGEFESNHNLSLRRAKALSHYIGENYRSATLPHIGVRAVGEDWGGLAELLKSSNIEGAAQAVEIIERSTNITQRKAQLKLMRDGRTYRAMLKELYPQLRRVEYRVVYRVKREHNLDQLEKEKRGQHSKH